MNRVAIYGASGCGRGVMPLARQYWANRGEQCELVFVDDKPSAPAVNGHAVMTYEAWLAQPATERWINVAIADSHIREKLVRRCEADGIGFFEVRASNVMQLDEVAVGEGAILCPFVTLTSNIKIGRHFHANLYSYVEHDCVIGDFVTFAPAVRCNGNVVIEDHAYIGAGAIIRQGQPGNPLVIGRGAVVGMGAVVTKNVPSNTTVAGNPARPLHGD
jgi:sugar O-acyltransferase (sialic acid O-acetyltransferase NeuD family)